MARIKSELPDDWAAINDDFYVKSPNVFNDRGEIRKLLKYPDGISSLSLGTLDTNCRIVNKDRIKKKRKQTDVLKTGVLVYLEWIQSIFSRISTFWKKCVFMGE